MSAESPALPPHSHLTPREVAIFLRVNLRPVYRLCEGGELPFLRWGLRSLLSHGH
jgi:excisionase family DNA binding protein